MKRFLDVDLFKNLKTDSANLRAMLVRIGQDDELQPAVRKALQAFDYQLNSLPSSVAETRDRKRSPGRQATTAADADDGCCAA